jgi:myo-inositol-1(or 4)-monophosphatase
MPEQAQRPAPPPIDRAELDAIEATALELARLAGVEITAALSRSLSVSYKTGGHPENQPTDPVSEVDHAVEALVRDRIHARFPGHAIVGEEVDEHPPDGHQFLWVIDPVDGTTNFINGFPLFAASIGILYEGWPVAGAIWCSASHLLRSGAYHASLGTPLRFEGELVPPAGAGEDVKRRLAAAPGGSPGRTSNWDNRVTGSAAIECAFVAAGIFDLARFGGLRIWDLAAGVVLAAASGHEAWIKAHDGWVPLDRFEPPDRVKEDRKPTLRDWSQPLVIGLPDAVQAVIPAPRSLWQRARRLLLPG